MIQGDGDERKFRTPGDGGIIPTFRGLDQALAATSGHLTVNIKHVSVKGGGGPMRILFFRNTYVGL
jgi:hypothetical protein